MWVIPAGVSQCDLFGRGVRGWSVPKEKRPPSESHRERPRLCPEPPASNASDSPHPGLVMAGMKECVLPSTQCYLILTKGGEFKFKFPLPPSHLTSPGQT